MCTIYVDPATHQRISFQPGCGDLQYTRQNGTALNTHAISIAISGISRLDQINRGRSNVLFGTDAALEGARLPDLDETGNNKQTTTRIPWVARVEV